MRQLFIDTETTGLHPHEGHRIIELAAVEMIDRKLTGNNFHVYINPERPIDPFATKVHGITDEMVKDKPLFDDIVDDFLFYLINRGHNHISEMLMHNAKFDVGHIDNELEISMSSRSAQLGTTYKHDDKRNEIPINRNLSEYGLIKCTLQMAWAMDGVEYVKGYKLDQLMVKYGVNIERKDHGALLDATILAHVYLAMTKRWYL